MSTTKKPHPLKGRKLSPELIAKMVEAKKIKRLARLNGDPPPIEDRTHDAVLYLRNAERSLLKEKRRYSHAELLMLLALRTLEGEI